MNDLPLERIKLPNDWVYRADISKECVEQDGENFRRIIGVPSLSGIHIMVFELSEGLKLIIIANEESDIAINEDCIGKDFFRNDGVDVMQTYDLSISDSVPVIVALGSYIRINKLYDTFDIRNANVSADNVGKLCVHDSFVEAQDLFMSKIFNAQFHGGKAFIYGSHFESCGFLNEQHTLHAFEVTIMNHVSDKDDRDIHIKSITTNKQ